MAMSANPQPQAKARWGELPSRPEDKSLNNIHAHDILDNQNNTQPDQIGEMARPRLTLLFTKTHGGATGLKPLEHAAAALR
jgi:hypothetical protein